MPFFQTRDGTAIHFNDWGAGKPVILIHGWPLSADMWEYQSVGLVEAGFRVIAYDRRGFGRSGQPWGGYSYQTLSDDLADLIAHIGATDGRPLTHVSLVGFSMGGGEIAALFGKHGGAGVDKVVLASSIAPFMAKTVDNPDGVDVSVFDDMIKGLRKDRPNFLADFGPNFYGVGLLTSPVSQAILNWTQQLALSASPRATIECVNAFGKTDLRAATARINRPTLVIHGDADKIVPHVMGEMAHKLIAGSQLKTYAGAPHGLFVTHKEKLLCDLKEFLA